MAKLRRQTGKAAASKTSAKKRPKASAAPSRAGAKQARATKSKAATISAAYAKAIALYEKALKAMQRRKFDAAATSFRQLIV
jgi:TolA-binding protein